MNQRYLQRFGDPQPFRDSIARAALRDDPEAPYGEPALGDNEGQRLFEQPDTKPLMTKDSMVAADDPYANYGAESGNDAGARQFMQPQYGSSTKPNLPAPVNDPYLNYDPEVPIRGERKLFQPPPTIESNAAKSIVLSEGEPKIDPERLSQPSQELPTAPPPESTLQRLIRQRLDNKLPERGPVSKWAKLAAVALGAGQGYYNAANPNARPIDASEAVQNLTFGRKYLDAMDKYQRTNKNLDEQIKLVGDAEDIESKIAERLDKQKTREDTNKDRDDIRIANNFRMGVEFAKSGSVVVPRGSPLTPGAVRIDANPLDPTGKTVVDVMPTGRQRIITDARVAKALGRKLNDSVSDAEYIQGAKEVWEYDKAIELKKLEVAAKPDSTLTTDYKNYQLSQKDGFKGTFEQWLYNDQNRKAPRVSIGEYGDGAYNPKQLQALTRLNESVSKNATFAKTTAMKNYNENVKAALAQTTGVGDIAAINQFQKVIDEGAVTRDQDVRLIQGSQSLLNSLRAQVSKLEKGQQLSPALRQQMIAATDAMYQAQLKAQAKDPYLLGKMKEAKRYGLKLEDTILDGMGDAQAPPAQNAGPGRSGGGNSLLDQLIKDHK